MENTVVNVEEVTQSNLIRSIESQQNLEGTLESLKRLLRGEAKVREIHKQLDNCFKVISQYLQINSLNQVNNINFDLIKEALRLIDIQLALVVTTADMHDQITEVITLFGNDLKEIMTKVSTSASTF